MITWLFNFLVSLKPSQAAWHPVERVASASLASVSLRGTTATMESAGRASTPMGHPTLPAPTSKVKPLRIIQWVEAASPAHPSNRRMVMSGRLADICAELDRLAALESA